MTGEWRANACYDIMTSRRGASSSYEVFTAYLHGGHEGNGMGLGYGVAFCPGKGRDSDT